MSWFEDIEPKVLTILETSIARDDIYFTRDPKMLTIPNLPCVYAHNLLIREGSRDLMQDEVHAVDYSVQIDVYSNECKEETEEICSLVMAVMKKNQFIIDQFPIYFEGGTMRAVMRFNRVISANDKVFGTSNRDKE
jgi:hypothetical protein